MYTNLVARPRLSRPTDAELQILAVIWSRGGSTVRELYNELKKIRGSGYNSVLKLVQIMHDKGYVRRDETVRPLIFHPTSSEQQTQKLMLKDLLDRAFGGSTHFNAIWPRSRSRARASRSTLIKSLVLVRCPSRSRCGFLYPP